MRFVYSGRGARPKRLCRDTPGALKDIGQFEHCHVTADAVALRRDSLQLTQHRVLQGGIAVVELERVGPAREIGVPTIGQDSLTPGRLNATPVLRLGRELFGRAFDEEIGVLVDPRVIGCDVVRDKVEHQSQIAGAQPLAQASERRVAAEIRVHVVVAHRKRRSHDVRLAEVGQHAPVLGQQIGVGRRDLARSRSGLPHAQEPDDVETGLGQSVQVGVRDLVERRALAQAKLLA